MEVYFVIGEENVPMANKSVAAAKRKFHIPQRSVPYVVLLPAFILTIGVLYPFVMAIYYSLTNYSFNNVSNSFVGLQNYTQMFSDPSFWHSFIVTVEYGLITTVVEMVLGMGIALLLNEDNRITRIMRGILMLPLMISPAVATLIWGLMTNPTYGIYSSLLNAIGIKGFTWANSPSTAMFTVVLIDAWIYIPFVVLLVMAGLRSLPQSPFESAKIDGGSFWFTFRTLTLPMLMPVILITLLFRLMTSIQQFTIIYGLTAGGPGNTLMNLSNLSYEHGFLYMNFGSSLSYLVFLWILIYIVSQIIVKYWGKAQARASGY